MIRRALIFLLSAAVSIAAEVRKNVPFAALPPAVLKMFQRQAAGGALPAEAVRVEEDGAVSFEAEIVAGGRQRDVTVGEDGGLLSIEVDFSETPPAVQKAVRAQVGTGELVGMDKEFDGGDSSYDVVMKTRDGQERAFTVEADGTISSLEVALSETPAAVQKTVTAQVGAGRVGSITRIADETVSYDVEMTAADGKQREFSVGGDGRLLSVRVSWEETPAAVQQTIRMQIGAGKILRIDHSFERRNKTLPYEIEALKDGKPFYFSVGEAGKFLGTDD